MCFGYAFSLSRSLIHMFKVSEHCADDMRIALDACGRGEDFERLRLIQGIAMRPIRHKRAVELNGAKNSGPYRNVFEGELIGIAGAVPPFVMPTHQQLHRAIGAGARGLLFANHRMSRQVNALFFAERDTERR